MDQLHLIRAFRGRAAAQRPDAKARARRALVEHMAEAPPRTARLRLPRPPFVRHTLSVAVTVTALAAAAAIPLIQALRDEPAPAPPAASAAQASPAVDAEVAVPVSSSYREYLHFASRMTRVELRTGAARVELTAAASFCAQAELAEIERLAIQALSASGWPRGTPVLEEGAAIELAERVGVSGSCRYAGFGVERARAVYGGLLPVSNLMPEAQWALPGRGLVGKPLL
jgi:hypothetical protein